MPCLRYSHDFTHDTYLQKAVPGSRLFKRIHASLPVVSSALLTKNLKVTETNVYYLALDSTIPNDGSDSRKLHENSYKV